MRRLRLYAPTAVLLVLTLGCINLCGDPEPPRALCDEADDATIDGIELDAFYEIGGQGSSMLMLNVTYLGTEAPECAELRYEVVDAVDGRMLTSGSQPVQTTEWAGGRRTREPHWMFWEFDEQVEVTVTAYGHSATDTVCRGDCVDAGVEEMDAGPGETDAGPGDTDAGPGDTDAGPGDTDAGPAPTDAGPEPTDAGSPDAG